MKKNHLTLAMLIILTSALSVSIPVFILQQSLEPPVTKIEPHLGLMIILLTRPLMIIGAMLIYFLSRAHWERMSLFKRTILFAFLLMAIMEQLFRRPMMSIALGMPLTYSMLILVPEYLYYFVLSLCISSLMPVILKKEKWWFLSSILFIALTSCLLFLVKEQLLKFIFAPLFASISINESSILRPPYDMRTLIPIYVSFIEPSIACFIVFSLVKDKLQRMSTFVKGILMGVLLSMMHGGIYSVLQILYSEGNMAYRAFYYGQWEYFTLGLLTAYSFQIKRAKC